MSYVLRLVLPDKPGTLGAVATELGKVDADILAMDIVERSPDQAVDGTATPTPAAIRTAAMATVHGLMNFRREYAEAISWPPLTSRTIRGYDPAGRIARVNNR